MNQHTADVMARVEGGERIEATRNGKAVAVIEPAASSPLSPLIDAGELRPAVGELPVFDDSDSFAADSAGLAAIIADRYRGGRD